MTLHSKFKFSAVSSVALAALVAGSLPAAMAADDVSVARRAGLEVTTRAPHKASNPFHRRHVITETAEFARLEMADQSEISCIGGGRPLVKSGNRFHPINR